MSYKRPECDQKQMTLFGKIKEFLPLGPLVFIGSIVVASGVVIGCQPGSEKCDKTIIITEQLTGLETPSEAINRLITDGRVKFAGSATINYAVEREMVVLNGPTGASEPLSDRTISVKLGSSASLTLPTCITD